MKEIIAKYNDPLGDEIVNQGLIIPSLANSNKQDVANLIVLPD